MVVDLRKPHEVRRDRFIDLAHLAFGDKPARPMSEALGVTYSHVHAMMSGTRRLNLETEEKVLKILQDRATDLEKQAAKIRDEAKKLKNEIEIQRAALSGYAIDKK